MFSKYNNDALHNKYILTDKQIDRMLGRSADGRYSYIKRAVKEGLLIRIKRGLYVRASNNPIYEVHPFYIAQAISPGSYISMESALSYHGWIPEAVYSTVSVKSGRKSKQYSHPIFGDFSFSPLAINRIGFLEGVQRIHENNQTWLMASPLRALMDLVAYKKIQWQGLEWLQDGLRIDAEHYLHIRKREFKSLKNLYKHTKANEFLEKFEHQINRSRP